jgi:DNA-binding response OmpR family regulator
MKILLVEDDDNLAEVLQRLLVKEGYVVDLADALAMAKEALLSNQYDIVILDRMLPDGDGLDLIRFNSERHKQNRFLVLSALNEIGQKVEGLNLGADDYVAKPFEPEELLARIKVSLRHPLQEIKKEVRCGNLSYDCVARDFRVNDQPLVLPRREMVVLESLIKRSGRVATREVIESEMYGYNDEILSNSLESHISKLRKNIKEHQIHVTIRTIRGVGYMLQEGL